MNRDREGGAPLPSIRRASYEIGIKSTSFLYAVETIVMAMTETVWDVPCQPQNGSLMQRRSMMAKMIVPCMRPQRMWDSIWHQTFTTNTMRRFIHRGHVVYQSADVSGKCSVLESATERNACYDELRNELSRPPAKGADCCNVR